MVSTAAALLPLATFFIIVAVHIQMAGTAQHQEAISSSSYFSKTVSPGEDKSDEQIYGAKKVFSRLQRDLAVAGIIIIPAVVLTALTVGRSLSRAVLRVSRSMEKVAQGDIEHSIDEFSSDEIGELGRAFNRMTRSLRDMILQVRLTSDQVVRQVQGLFSNTQELSSSTQEISRALVKVSQGAVIQAEKINDTFSVMEKTAESFKQVVKDAQSTSEAVGLTSKNAYSGKNTAAQAVDKIAKLTHTVAETSSVIQELGQFSLQIGEIIETINIIAEQTNLLALNAAIEAARAGEAGRGFSVVAEEVRKLSESSADSVRKVAGLIKSIQNESHRAVNAIEESSREVEEGKSSVLRIAQALNDINSNVAAVSTFSANISQTGNARISEVERVVQSIDEITKTAHSSAAEAQQVSSTTQEQMASMQEMAASAQELTNLALELEAMVSKFKIKTDSAGR